MKIKCDKCGEREAELMSKAEIKMSSFSPDIASKVLDIVADLFSPKYIVCKACGYTKEA